MFQIRDMLAQKSRQLVEVCNAALSTPLVEGNRAMTQWIRAMLYIVSGNTCESLYSTQILALVVIFRCSRVVSKGNFTISCRLLSQYSHMYSVGVITFPDTRLQEWLSISKGKGSSFRHTLGMGCLSTRGAIDCYLSIHDSLSCLEDGPRLRTWASQFVGPHVMTHVVLVINIQARIDSPFSHNLSMHRRNSKRNTSMHVQRYLRGTFSSFT